MPFLGGGIFGFFVATLEINASNAFPSSERKEYLYIQYTAHVGEKESENHGSLTT